MIQAFLDESGIHEHAGICVIAGYFGGPSQMRKLGREWEGVLNRYQVPEFHAKEFWGFDNLGNRVGPYKGWSNPKADAFIELLVSLIERHRKVHPVGSAVVVESFNKLSYNQRRFITGGHIENGKFKSSGCPSKPYFLPFQTCVIDVADHAPIGGKAQFFVDHNKQFMGYALDLFALLKTQGLKVTERLGDIHFPTGTEAVQLQVADLLCYQSYHFGLKRIANPAERHPPILDRLIANRFTQTDSFFDDSTIPLVLNGIEIPADR